MSPLAARPAALAPTVVLAASAAAGARGVERVRLRARETRAALERCARRLALRLPAGRLPADERGAPLPLRDARGGAVHASWTHGGDLVAASLAPLPVGIDLEPVRLPRPEIVAAAASAAELALCGDAGAREPEALAFARAWTAKEAVLKRAGCGLGELSRARIVAREGAELLLVRHRGEVLAVRSVLRAVGERLHAIALCALERESVLRARLALEPEGAP